MPNDLTFGATEARTRFSQLLDEVEKGRVIVITRKGKPIAKLMPIGEAPAIVPQGDIVEAFRRLRKGRKLGTPIRRAIGEGRRR